MAHSNQSELPADDVVRITAPKSEFGVTNSVR